MGRRSGGAGREPDPRRAPEASVERRLGELESTCAFQERALTRLDEVVRAFAARVERLEGEVARLRAAAGGPGGGGG